MQSFSRFLPIEYITRSKISKAITGKKKEWYVSKLEMLSNITASTCIGDEYDKDLKVVLENADNVLNGTIRILGGDVEISNINWHKDFKSDYQWKKGLFYKKYKPTRFNTSEDVKTVWDLSRCQFLLWLGQAYMATKEEKYAKRVVELINDWITENPYRKSINWTCPMDIAIRAINWIYATSMVSSSEAVNEAFLKHLFNSLFQHGKFIYSNLEYQYPFSANHYATNVMGLLYLGKLFEFTKEGGEWFRYSTKSFLYEVRTQVLPTGVHFERSISYHRLMCEIFLYSYDLLKRIAPESVSSTDIEYRIKSMIEFIDCYTKPSGNSPLFGDNDDGRILPFVERPFYDHRYLLDIAAHIFGRKTYKNCIGNVLDTIYFTKGKKEETGITSFNNKIYPDAGFAILKNDDFYVMLSNTGISRYLTPQMKKAAKIGTHTHLDALTFELSAGKSDFIVDAGSFTYTSDKRKRDEYRSTAKHNTLTVNNLSQYTLNPKDYFCFNGEYKDPMPIIYGETAKAQTATSSFCWQLNEGEKVEHNRSIILQDKFIEVCDKVETNATERNYYEWNFYLATDIIAERKENEFILYSSKGDTLVMTVECNKMCYVDICECYISPSYGIEVKSHKIKVSITSKENLNIKFTYKTK